MKRAARLVVEEGRGEHAFAFHEQVRLLGEYGDKRPMKALAVLREVLQDGNASLLLLALRPEVRSEALRGWAERLIPVLDTYGEKLAEVPEEQRATEFLGWLAAGELRLDEFVAALGPAK